eukprot:gene3830-2233_t
MDVLRFNLLKRWWTGEETENTNQKRKRGSNASLQEEPENKKYHIEMGCSSSKGGKPTGNTKSGGARQTYSPNPEPALQASPATESRVHSENENFNLITKLNDLQRELDEAVKLKSEIDKGKIKPTKQQKNQVKQVPKLKAAVNKLKEKIKIEKQNMNEPFGGTSRTSMQKETATKDPIDPLNRQPPLSAYHRNDKKEDRKFQRFLTDF